MKPRQHKFICAIDGMMYHSDEKRIRWDGAIVHRKNLEPRHPQEVIKSVKEDTSVSNPRGEPGDGSDQAEDYTYVYTYATGATETAGAEGTYTPTGGVAPATLSLANQEDRGVIRFVASPATAWSTSSFMTLGDANTMHWNASKWVDGTAP